MPAYWKRHAHLLDGWTGLRHGSGMAGAPAISLAPWRAPCAPAGQQTPAPPWAAAMQQQHEQLAQGRSQQQQQQQHPAAGVRAAASSAGSGGWEPYHSVFVPKPRKVQAGHPFVLPAAASRVPQASLGHHGGPSGPTGLTPLQTLQQLMTLATAAGQQATHGEAQTWRQLLAALLAQHGPLQAARQQQQLMGLEQLQQMGRAASLPGRQQPPASAEPQPQQPQQLSTPDLLTALGRWVSPAVPGSAVTGTRATATTTTGQQQLHAGRLSGSDASIGTRAPGQPMLLLLAELLSSASPRSQGSQLLPPPYSTPSQQQQPEEPQRSMVGLHGAREHDALAGSKRSNLGEDAVAAKRPRLC